MNSSVNIQLQQSFKALNQNEEEFFNSLDFMLAYAGTQAVVVAVEKLANERLVG